VPFAVKKREKNLTPVLFEIVGAEVGEIAVEIME
jgi:hypothetical protein